MTPHQGWYFLFNFSQQIPSLGPLKVFLNEWHCMSIPERKSRVCIWLQIQWQGNRLWQKHLQEAAEGEYWGAGGQACGPLVHPRHRLAFWGNPTPGRRKWHRPVWKHPVHKLAGNWKKKVEGNLWKPDNFFPIVTSLQVDADLFQSRWFIASAS